MGRRVGLAAIVAAVVLVAAGCELLYGLPVDPDASYEPPKPAYVEGRATVRIGDGPLMVFDELSRAGTYDSLFGGDVTFRGDDGWSLQVTGAMDAGGVGGFMPPVAWTQLDRIVDGQHWTVADPSRCIVTAQADPFAFRGTATCKGLRWSDAIGRGYAEPEYIADQPAFDAEITFEATGKATSVS